MMPTPYRVSKTKTFAGVKYTKCAREFLGRQECKLFAKTIRGKGIKARMVYEMPKWCVYYVLEEIDMLQSWRDIPDDPIGARIMHPLHTKQTQE